MDINVLFAVDFLNYNDVISLSTWLVTKTFSLDFYCVILIKIGLKKQHP